MDFALDSVNHAEGDDIRSIIKSYVQLQQEYNPCITIDEDSDDAMTSQPSMENEADDAVEMGASNLALDAQISYPMLEAAGSPVDSTTSALANDEQASRPVLLDAAEAPVHRGTTMLVEEAEGWVLLPVTEQAAQANSESKEHSRWSRWFSCVSCSRRSRPVAKRKMEDESKEMNEPDAKRYRH